MQPLRVATYMDSFTVEWFYRMNLPPLDEPMLKVDFQAIVRAYDRFLDKGSDDARRVGWRNAKSQQRKFAEITQILPAYETPFSVYDVGCGLASLYDFLKRTYPLARYRGCDIHPGMIERARLRNPDLDLECRDILRSPPRVKFDYVLASGTFTVHPGSSKGRWDAYVKEMLQTLYRIAKRGVAVGFLSSLAKNKESTEYHPNPSAILDFAQRRLSPFAEIRHSQSPGHFALLIYRSPRLLVPRLRE